MLCCQEQRGEVKHSKVVADGVIWKSCYSQAGRRKLEAIQAGFTDRIMILSQLCRPTPPHSPTLIVAMPNLV